MSEKQRLAAEAAMDQLLQAPAPLPKGGHPGYVWVCGACGKHTAPGESAMALRDASCYCWAVLCYPQSAEEKAERRWRAADGEEDLT